MDEIIFLMEVNKYFEILYRPYDHAATLLIIEFQTTRWISCSAHKISNNKVQSFLYTFKTMLKSYSSMNKNPLKHPRPEPVVVVGCWDGGLEAMHGVYTT